MNPDASSREVELSRELLRSRDVILRSLNATGSLNISEFKLTADLTVYSAESTFTIGARRFVGHGQSKNRILAASKAFGESLERWVVQSRLARSIQLNQPGLPNGLRSTNGWAIHFEREKALANAKNECLERTILQIAFVSRGWAAFELHQEFELSDKRCRIWLTKQSYYSAKAGIVEASLKNFPGRTFGYFLRTSADSFTWTDIFHPVFEAFAPSLFYDRNRNHLPDPLDSIEVAQHDLVTRPFHYHGHAYPKEATVNENFNVNSSEIDLGVHFGIDLPLYAVHCFGGNAIPLIIHPLDQPSKSYLNSSFAEVGMVGEMNYAIPIL